MSPMKYSWDLIHTFDTVAKTGSLLAASRVLNVSQPTVGRHIDMLENAMGISLFIRSREGMALTDAGADLVSTSGDLVRAATEFERRSLGLDKEVSGVVRITANDVLGVHVLPAMLQNFMATHPEIEIELDITNSAANLSRRDADIALRMFRPVQNDLFAQKATEIPLGFYAHNAYLERAKPPATLADLQDHKLIGFDRETLLVDAAKTMGAPLTSSDFIFRTDNILAQIAAVKAGIGIGILHQGMAATMDHISRVLPEIALPALDLWIVSHADVRHNTRIRLLVDFLAKTMRNPYGQPPTP